MQYKFAQDFKPHHVIREKEWYEESKRRRALELLEKIANNSSKSDDSLIYGITGAVVGLGIGMSMSY